MKENKLIDNIANIYKNSLESEKNARLKNDLFYFLREKTVSINSLSIKDKHEKLGIPDHITKNLISALELEYQSAKQIQNNLEKRTKEEMIRESTESYLSSINSFTSNGGKNFYDIGSIIDIDDINSKNIIKEKIKELQSNGVDIKIIKEKEKDINGDIHSVIALVIPSSQYKEFEKMIVNDLSKNENDFIRFSRRNYFIPPFIRDRDMIETLEDNIPTSKVFETINYNIFCVYGYSTHTIDTSGGYGQFNDGERATINLYNTIYSSLAHANLYENKNNHINGIMPTLMCFSKDDVKNLVPDNEDKIRKTIVKDLKLYEKEQNIKQTTTLEEEQNKPKNKRLKRN